MRFLAPGLLALLLSGCVSPVGEDVGAAEGELAHPGRWIPAEAGPSVGYDGAPSWSGGANCSGSFTPGARELGDYLRATFPGVAYYQGYACRQNTGDTSRTSVHGTGRAIDVFIPLDGGQADNDLGDPVGDWLISHAAEIGVQYIIWDRTSWSGSRSGDRQRYYSGPHPHHDHLHVELTIAGGDRRAPWFSAPPPPPPPSCGDYRVAECGFLYGCGCEDDTCQCGVRPDFLWYGERDGTFTSRAIDVNGLYVPVVGDFDGDGSGDVLWYGRGTRRDYVWYGQADRSFVSRSESVLGIYAPFVGDFDGDGRDDVFWYAAGTAADTIYFGREGGGFDSLSVDVRGTYEPAVGDFDGDGRDDIFWYAPGASADTIWYFAADRSHVSVPRDTNGRYVLIVGDFDGSGTDDVIFYGAGPDPDYLTLGRPERGLVDGPRIELPSLYFTGVGDFDADGHDDVIFYGPGAAPDEVWYGSADATFDSHSVSVRGDYRIRVGDFDKDGSSDVLFYADGEAADYVWRRAQDRAFDSVRHDVRGTYQPLVIDFDGDTADDILWYGPGSDPDESGSISDGLGESPDRPADDEDGDGVAAADDCDDADAAIHPLAPEICEDGVDQDCDGEDALCVNEEGAGPEVVEPGDPSGEGEPPPAGEEETPAPRDPSAPLTSGCAAAPGARPTPLAVLFGVLALAVARRRSGGGSATLAR